MANLDPKYQIGIAPVDTQHAEIIKILQDAMNTIKAKNKKNKIEDLLAILGKLKNYANTHFDYEEKFMQKIAYPHLEDHIKLHVAFRERLQDLSRDTGVNNENEKLKEAAIFIRKWFLEHIAVEDMKIGEFYGKKGK